MSADDLQLKDQDPSHGCHLGEFLPLADYERITRTHLFRYSRPLAQAVLRDVDWFGELVGAVIQADVSWDGRVSLPAWRKMKLLWSLKDAVKRRQTQKARRECLVQSLHDDGWEPILAVESHNPATIAADKELAEYALACPALKERERRFLRLRYLEGWQLKDAAAEQGLDPRNAPRLLNRAIKKIRLHLEIDLL